MTRQKSAFAAALLIFTSFTAEACASSSARVESAAPPSSAIEEPSAPSVSSPAAIAEARQDSIRRPYTTFDIDFMSHMIGHHAQAVLMASWAPTHGASKS